MAREELAALGTARGVEEGDGAGWSPKVPVDMPLTGAGLAVTVLQLLTPKFPASLELSFTCLWETPPGMLLRAGNPHICSARPESAGVLGVTSGTALAPPRLCPTLRWGRGPQGNWPPDVREPGLLGQPGSPPA